MYKSIFLSGVFFLFLSSNLLASDKFIITVHPSAHPFGWHEDGKVKGAAVELMKLVAKDLDIPVETTVLPWRRSIKHAKSGEIDGVLTAFYTEQRAQFMKYTKAYETVDTSVFVKKNKEFDFQKWDDLIGKTGLTIVGDSQGDKWDKFENEKLNIIRVVHIEQIFEMLSNDRADFAVFPRIATLREIKKMGYNNKIINLPKPITSQGVYIAISKKSPFFNKFDLINERIEFYVKNGTYQKLQEKAFNQKD